MLNYFLKHRHGSVTIFCSIILIAILSFRSLMVEIGRMRSIDALLSEAMDNAAFSTLSNYDAALYKRFALLALNPDVDDETFNNYLRKTLNEYNSDKILSDSGAEMTADASMDKIYDLTDEKVLKSQIEELHKYRGVMDIASTYVDYEKAIEAILSFFDKNLVYLQFFTNMTDRADVIIEYFAAIGKYYKATKALDLKQEEYYDAADEYNEARSAYEDTMNDSDATTEEKNSAASELGSKKTKLEKAIDDLYQCIHDMIEAESDYQVALGNMTDDLVSSVISEEIVALNNGGGNYESLTEEEKQNYRDFLTGMDADIDVSQGIFDKLTNFLQGEVLEILEEYAEDVLASKSTISETEDYDAVELGFISEAICNISALCSTLFTIIDEIITLIKNIIQSIEVFLGFTDCIEIFCQMNLGFSPYYTSSITNAGQLPYSISNHNDVDYSAILNPDKQLVTDEYNGALANKVAGEVGYNLGFINPGVNAEASLLGDIIENIVTHLNAACDNIKFLVDNALHILDKFEEIINAFKSLINNLKAVLKYIFDFIKIMTSIVADAICDMIYSHAIVANYAVGVFPNRTTEITDPNILGEPWMNYLDGWAQYDDMHTSGLSMSSNTNFSKCRAEYIFAGTSSEIFNQQIVYFILLIQRFTASTPALFTNKLVRDNLLKLCETGLGAIIAVVLAIIYVYIEACMDMLLLTYGGQELPIIKVFPWMSVKNIPYFVGCLMDIKAQKITKATLCDWGNTKFGSVTKWGGWALNKVAGDKIEGKMQSFLDQSYSHFNKQPTEIVDVSGQAGAAGGGGGDKALNGVLAVVNVLMPKWDYTDYLMMYIALLPEDIVLGRMENLIQLEMKQAYDSDFDLKNARTYIRTEVTVKYKPILPIPVISDMEALKLHQIKYEGY